MKIRMTNCDPTRRDEIRAAMKFYAQKLFTSRIIENLDFRVTFVPNMRKTQKIWGEIYPHRARRLRKFTIRIAEDAALKNQLMAIAHEMAHAKQYANDEMREIGMRWTRWQGKKMLDDNIIYWDRPWEIDARGWETGLYIQWQQHKKKMRLTEIEVTI